MKQVERWQACCTDSDRSFIVLNYRETFSIFVLYLLICHLSGKCLMAFPNSKFSFYFHLGAIFYYVSLQLALWWFFHVSALFWKIRFPFHAKATESAHRTKYIHITMVLLALVLPLVPVIAAFATTGFVLSRFPAILCLGSNANAAFYSLVLPLILLLKFGITLLIVVFWTIHKVCKYCL